MKSLIFFIAMLVICLGVSEGFDVNGSCSKDYDMFCSDNPFKRESDMINCLKEHQTELSNQCSAEIFEGEKKPDIDTSVQLTGRDWYILGLQNGECIQQSPQEWINSMKSSGVTIRVVNQKKDYVSLYSPTLNKHFAFIKGESACEDVARMMGLH